MAPSVQEEYDEDIEQRSYGDELEDQQSLENDEDDEYSNSFANNKMKRKGPATSAIPGISKNKVLTTIDSATDNDDDKHYKSTIKGSMIESGKKTTTGFSKLMYNP